ncbi:MAG: hypothetical protein JXR73_18210, partial [Candidatus Omnitrophica bacterium]|nr:hypothetical protein [Candidatus Omnitrophota bacterium]
MLRGGKNWDWEKRWGLEASYLDNISRQEKGEIRRSRPLKIKRKLEGKLQTQQAQVGCAGRLIDDA